MGGAGAIEAIVTAKSIQESRLHPTINLDDPEESIKNLDIVRKAEDFKVDVALSNSFGFGGHNSALLFARYFLMICVHMVYA